MTTIRDQLIRFVELLRARGVRISVAESMDGLRAVAAAGFERAAMREALAATLIKDEGDRPIFDDAFAGFFRAPGLAARRPGQNAADQQAQGGGRGGERALATARSVEPERPKVSERISKREEKDNKSEERRGERTGAAPEESAEARVSAGSEPEREAAARGLEAIETPRSGIEAERYARLRAAERKPFTQYSDLDYQLAREALKPLARRFRVRVGRRLRLARRGRIDFRRTIRASTQRGGALLDLRFRSRRPRHIDLLILADISGSVRYSSTLMLELIAGARRCFRRVRSCVYVDRLAGADFEDGHLVMAPALDLYALSDFGRVLGELWQRRAELLGRAVLLVIMGDARNNRRPPRADLLREIARLCRAVIWLNPEEPQRWGSGDSAIRLYEREVNAVLPARNLRELETGLLRVA